jgi:hypothetical protein
MYKKIKNTHQQNPHRAEISNRGKNHMSLRWSFRLEKNRLNLQNLRETKIQTHRTYSYLARSSFRLEKKSAQSAKSA